MLALPQLLLQNTAATSKNNAKAKGACHSTKTRAALLGSKKTTLVVFIAPSNTKHNRWKTAIQRHVIAFIWFPVNLSKNRGLVNGRVTRPVRSPTRHSHFTIYILQSIYLHSKEEQIFHVHGERLCRYLQRRFSKTLIQTWVRPADKGWAIMHARHTNLGYSFYNTASHISLPSITESRHARSNSEQATSLLANVCECTVA